MNIYVGNLSRQAGESEVRTLFEQFGEVKAIKIIKDQVSGESRGFAFVEMTDHAAGTLAVQTLESKEFQNRRLKVNEAKPKGPTVYNSFSNQYGYKNRYEKY